MIVTKQRLEDTIHYIPGSRIVYLNNAKVACSTIKKSLWLWRSPATFDPARGPHDRSFAPFAGNLQSIPDAMNGFKAASFFSVARNPFSRILSAYLDKVGRRPRDAAVWFPFARRHRLSGDAMPSFPEFLKMVASEDRSVIDQHFAPQFFNILQPFTACDFIGHIERFADVETYLRFHGIQLSSHIPHPTNANSALHEFYSPAEIKIVREYYDADFRIFGYSDDPNELGPVRPIEQICSDKRRLTLLLQCYTAKEAAARQQRIDELSGEVKDLDTTYIRLENGLVPASDLRALSEKVQRGEISNWKLVARIARELLAQDMLQDAAATLNRAIKLTSSG